MGCIDTGAMQKFLISRSPWSFLPWASESPQVHRRRGGDRKNRPEEDGGAGGTSAAWLCRGDNPAGQRAPREIKTGSPALLVFHPGAMTEQDIWIREEVCDQHF